MGRALGNNLINLGAYEEVKEALEELGLDLNVLEDQEPDPALGQWRSGKTGSMFPGFSGNSWLLLLMDAVSVTVMVCSSRRSGTAIR